MPLNRRAFIRISSFGLVAGALSLPRVHAAALPRNFRSLRRNVGTFSESGGTIGWLVNGDGIVVVDSQFPDPARTFLQGLEGRDGRPIDVLLNSHHHGDHTGGNAVFRDDTRQIVAHARARELHAASGGADAEPGLADETFQESWTVEVGDERVHARHYGPAHTGGDCTVHFERANVVHMGDLVFNRAYPFIDRPGGASVQGWVDLIDAVVSRHDADTIFIFGHGQPEFGVTGSREDVRVQGDFLEALLETARRARQEGRSRDEVLATTEIPGFPDHRALNERLNAGAALAVAFDELSGGG
jgi:cyclase